MDSSTLPSVFPRLKLVSSFQELITTRFADGINALCWPRSLPGDFAEVVQRLGESAGEDGIATLNEEVLLALELSPAGQQAVAVLLEDLRQMREQDLQPSLDCIHQYLRDEEGYPVATDVYSFHVDSATEEADTYLCTYFGPSSEGLANEQAQRRVDIPKTRAELLELFGGEEGAAFQEFLHEQCFDLHYLPLPDAQPFVFGIGHLWRIATEYPGSPVPPCIHRAPETQVGQPPRLLLIS
jgi:hypothetical protein